MYSTNSGVLYDSLSARDSVDSAGKVEKPRSTLMSVSAPGLIA